MTQARNESDYEGGELEGQSFRNESLTGSGTILPDGTYGEPLPDPTEVRGIGPRRTSGGRIVPEPNMFAEEVPTSVQYPDLRPRTSEWGKGGEDSGGEQKAQAKTDTPPKTETAAPKKATGSTK